MRYELQKKTDNGWECVNVFEDRQVALLELAWLKDMMREEKYRLVKKDGNREEILKCEWI